MDLDEIVEQEEDLKTGIKKSCMLCMGRAHLGSGGTPEKDRVQADLKQLYNLYETEFDKQRKEDAEASDIQKAGDNKRFVLDTVSICSGCDREVDRANRAVNELK